MEEPRYNGMEWRAIVPAGHGLGISRISLIGDPSSAGGNRMVNVSIEIGGEEYKIATLSPEAPVVAGPPVVFGGEFVLRYDCAADIVRFDVYALPMPASFDDEEAAVEYEPLSEDDQAELYDSDNGDDNEGDGEEGEPPGKVRDGDGEATGESSNIPLVAAPDGSVLPEGEFIGPARFAAVENTAGFMRVATAAMEAPGDQEEKEILVLYRYTRFSRTRQSGRRGVEACRRTKLHRLRFAVPPVGDMASSLAWAGASLSPLIYPALFRRQLQDLWSSLAAPAITTIPPRATHVQVVVNVGILRREDHTPERMELMRAALEAAKGEAWPAGYHGIRDLHLPEPVRRRDREDYGTRPAKRRRVAGAEDDDEECSVCLEALESDLAVWPGCGHVFHGSCVEMALARSEMCPLCRHKLSDPCSSRPSKRTRANVVCTRCSIR